MKHILYFFIGVFIIGVIIGAIIGVLYLLGHYVCPLFGYNTYHYLSTPFEDDLFYGFGTLIMIICVPSAIVLLYGLGRSLIKGDI